ncbi:MAG: TolC family protein [Verrucomicrobiae bacterium]|nr:TolC family protein [Verrucomicrobiae bacterium]
MSLHQTLEQVVEANLRLQVSQLDYDIAEERAKAEWAIFEPVLLLTLAQESNNRQNTTEQFLSQRVSIFDEHNEIYSGAIEGVLPTGGKVRVGTQIRNLDNNLQTTGRREWESYSGVTVTQPLLRNRGWKSVASQIELAAGDSSIALQDYRGQLALVLSEAEMAYWELAAASLFVELSQASVETAEIVLKENRQRFDAGKTTEMEVVQSEAGLALRKSHLSNANQRRVDANARLAAFLGRKADNVNIIVPADPIELVAQAPSLSRALSNGVNSHPAYLAQVERCNQAGIRLAFAENEKLPQLDLKASYGLNGLANTFKGTLDEGLIDRDFPSWYLGVEFRFPLTNGKRERHQLAAADIRKRQSLLELSAIEIDLVNGIHALVEKVGSLGERSSALNQVVHLHERVLDNEQEFLKAGKSESRKVLEAEEDLSEARLESLSAMLELRRANVDLLVQEGTYLRDRGFELVDVEEPVLQ